MKYKYVVRIAYKNTNGKVIDKTIDSLKYENLRFFLEFDLIKILMDYKLLKLEIENDKQWEED